MDNACSRSVATRCLQQRAAMRGTRRIVAVAGLGLLAIAVLLLGTSARAFAQADTSAACTAPSGDVASGATFSCVEGLGDGGTSATVSVSSPSSGATLIGLDPTGAVNCTPTTTLSADGSGGTVSCDSNSGFFTGLVETFTTSSSATASGGLTESIGCTPANSGLTSSVLTAGPGSCGSGTATTMTVSATPATATAAPITAGIVQPSSGLITVRVDRGNGATYYSGDPITICVSLNFSGPNIYQSNSFPVTLTDSVSGGNAVVIFQGRVSGTGQQCLTRAISAPFGAETITGVVSDPINNTRIASASVSFTSAPRSNTPPQVSLNPSTTSAAIGQSISFNVNAAPGSGAALQSLTLNFGDGLILAVTPGTTIPHAYAASGLYTATLIAVDTRGVAASTSTSITIGPGTPPPPPPGSTVTYQPGWNLIAAPTGTVITGNAGPLYTLQPGSGSYVTVASGTQLSGGLGYWAYFTSPTTQSLIPTAAQTIIRPLPPGQWVMIGNPGTGTATISGADVAYVYDPVRGYTATTILQPGQGAWALSVSGSSVTIRTIGP